jgi:cytoskeletal protein CcmA (bactofilin family)
LPAPFNKKKGRDMKFFDKKENSTNAPNPGPANSGTTNSPQQQQQQQPQAPRPQQQPQPPAPDPQKYAPKPPAPTPTPAPVTVQAPVITTPVTSPTVATVLGTGLIIRGDIQSEDSITVEGVVEGTIVSSRDVVVGPHGKLRASIRTNNVTISGRVVGDVTATNKVELAPAGQLQGNIRSPKLSIAETALFKGNIDMSGTDLSSRDDKKLAPSIPEPAKK